MEKEKIYICIDDTDEIGFEKSTGEISEDIKEHIENNFNIECSLVTRHQLFIHEDIPYTSHNSSMCFTSFLDENEKQQLKEYIISYIKSVCAPSSQPGLCIAFEKDILDIQSFIQYGLDAKQKVLTKDYAFEVAKKHNLELFSLVDDAQGVVGALAGIALRLYGNDGRVKGKLKPKKEISTVKELLEYDEIDEVRLEDGTVLLKDETIHTNNDLKMVYLDYKYILLVEKKDGVYKVISKENLKRY